MVVLFCCHSVLSNVIVVESLPFSVRVDRASATEMVDSGSIPGRA